MLLPYGNDLGPASAPIDFPAIRPYANSIGKRGNNIVSALRAILMVLITLRLLMPPGICACKWTSPAACLLLAFTQSERQIPLEQQRDNDDDHDAGCPASPLAAGMGVAPPCQPLLPPGLSLDPLPPPAMQLFTPVPIERITSIAFDEPSVPLYVTVRALLL